MRLIDADKLKKEIAKRTPHFAQRIAFTSCFDAIRNAPTVDAVPVAHGYWTEESECSQCGKYVYKGDIDNFCPHCGARMDEDEQHS